MPCMSSVIFEQVSGHSVSFLPACVSCLLSCCAAATNLHTMQAFDGPVPETLNGCLCMLSIPIAVFEEWQTHDGMWEQVLAQ